VKRSNRSFNQPLPKAAVACQLRLLMHRENHNATTSRQQGRNIKRQQSGRDGPCEKVVKTLGKFCGTAWTISFASGIVRRPRAGLPQVAQIVHSALGGQGVLFGCCCRGFHKFTALITTTKGARFSSSTNFKFLLLNL
jgi:hypothetical protein